MSERDLNEGTGTLMSDEEVDALVEEMAKAIKFKIKKNAFKGTPIGLNSGNCFKRMIDESAELFEASFSYNANVSSAMMEAADVACFAFFCAMNVKTIEEIQCVIAHQK